MKYAYLIIANRNYNQLQKLIKTLDDSRNDIYLMIDKKSSFPHNFKADYSTIIYVKPINIYWGDYSLVKAELYLFQAAASEHYTYYHLLSGLDLPLVNQDVIHNFFDNHLNQEFITYGDPINLPELSSRLKHHLFRHYYRTHSHFVGLYRKMEAIYLHLFKCGIPKYKLDYGSQWVSLDDNLVQFIVRHKEKIQYIYRYGYLVDEVFIPTLLNFYPGFKNRVYYKRRVHNNPNEFQGNMRYINWWDGNPYTWRLKDYTELKNAREMGHLFSRKFDENIDNNIINKIFNDIMYK